MAASIMTVTCDLSSPEMKKGGRKSKKIITIDLSSISRALNRRDDTIDGTKIVNTMNAMNTINTMNAINTINITQNEAKDECCREDHCLNNNNNNIEAEHDADADVDAHDDADADADAHDHADVKNGYYYRNREKKLEYQKNYNREQGDKIKNYNKDYYQKRREEILEKAKTKITCECGCEVQLFNMNSHKKTKKHVKALAAINAKL